VGEATIRTHTVVVGASAAGLATAACLKERGLDCELLEATDHVAHAWRNHYDRLHLHTPRGGSSLPYLKMPRSYPKYPSRDQVVAYLERYCRHFRLRPRFGTPVDRIRRLADGRWECASGELRFVASNVVVATGYTREPVRPEWPGMETFPGEILHSSKYRNAARWAGQDVLVVGFGNSGCEIAIDVHEHGARPGLAVRSPVNIVPRDVLGLPVLSLGIAMRHIPTRLADALSRPLTRLFVGDWTRWGLRRLPYGPNAQIREHRRIPLLDIGTVALLKRGEISAHPGIAGFDGADVVFTDGSRKRYDAVVLATGYRPAVGAFLEDADAVTDEAGVPVPSGRPTALPGLYFCGFDVAPSGMLREIAIEAKAIAGYIARGATRR